jgi:hypothetical protein
VAAAGGWKHPPDGVPTESVPGRASIPLSVAAKRAGVDRRTLQAAVLRGDIEGWAQPGPRYVHWFVYTDALPSAPTHTGSDELGRMREDLTRLRAEVAELQRSPRSAGVLPVDPVTESVMADLRARLVAVEETNLLLMEAQGKTAEAAELYRQALALFMTPGHAGELVHHPGS